MRHITFDLYTIIKNNGGPALRTGAGPGYLEKNYSSLNSRAGTGQWAAIFDLYAGFRYSMADIPPQEGSGQVGSS